MASVLSPENLGELFGERQMFGLKFIREKNSDDLVYGESFMNHRILAAKNEIYPEDLATAARLVGCGDSMSNADVGYFRGGDSLSEGYEHSSKEEAITLELIEAILETIETLNGVVVLG